MSGHSKWANIKNKKEKSDAQRGKIFTKIGRELAVAVKLGGADPESNSKLKDTIAKAKASNMPNDTIMRSIKKASGELGGADYEEITYEGYGPNGVAVIVEALTDNRNRTAGEVRHVFDKNGGNLGANGCVGWMFDRKGVIVVENNGKIDEDDFMMKAIEAGADDVNIEEEYFEIVTSPEEFSSVREELENKGIEFETAEVQMVPQNYTRLDEDSSVKMQRLIDALEDNDDVQNVYSNWEEE